MPLFSRFKNKGAQPASKDKTAADQSNGHLAAPPKPKWVSNWNSKSVVLEEIEELVHACTTEMKSRAEALDAPFLLLPFRPDSDASGARTFIRNFFKSNQEGSKQYQGSRLQQELRLTEPIVLCSILKWCWSRIAGGVVTWTVYDGFQIGEKEANFARNAFETFIPIVAESSARKSIIFDFYDLMAAVAAHGKMNGLGGRKLSRLAGWWAFEHADDGKGFEGGYRSWTAAADASTHLFFAYLRTLSPEEHPSMSLIERIPRSLQALLASTEYPPETPTLMQKSTPRVVMLVDAVSPTPFALLRRAKHFEYRDNDRVLRHYSEFEDPVFALTEECKRVLNAISNTGSSAAKSRHGNAAKRDESWSAFSNTGFADMDEKSLSNGNRGVSSAAGKPQSQGLRSEPRSRDHGRPTTPSWADFMDTGFVEDETNKNSTTLLLPPDKQLPPLSSRVQSPNIPEDENVAPGELAAIANVELDDAFWWVWMTSLAGEEPPERKAVFGRCAVIETSIMGGRWLIMEEQVKGASPDPTEGMYIAKKKGFFSFTKRGMLTRKRSSGKVPPAIPPQPVQPVASPTPSKRSLAPDQQSKIKQAAAALKKQEAKDDEANTRRGRYEDEQSKKTNSVLTIGLQSEAGPAMKWASSYDKSAIRQQYLGDPFAGTGQSREDLFAPSPSVNGYASSVGTPAPALSPERSTFPINDSTRELPSVPKEEEHATQLAPMIKPDVVDVVPSNEPRDLPQEIDSIHQDTEDDYSPEPTPAVGANEMDKELAVDAPSSPHPAYRQDSFPKQAPPPAPATYTPTAPAHATYTPTRQSPQSPTQNAAVLAAQRAMVSNDASPKTGSQAKTNKQSGGLKKLFGRKKEPVSRPSMDVGPTSGSNLAPPAADQSVARRISLLRKKPVPVDTTKDSQPEASHTNASELEAEPVVPGSYNSIQNTSASGSHVDLDEHKHAEEEFARFDQGPVDMPSSTPQNSTPDLAAPQAQRSFDVQKVATTNGRDSLVQYGGPPEDDTASETTMEEPKDTAAESKDRWAIIRENAAKRAAQRASEEQSTQSRPSQSARTDDGETSGEETIESRVARIKARVAELTGGMDNGAAPRR